LTAALRSPAVTRSPLRLTAKLGTDPYQLRHRDHLPQSHRQDRRPAPRRPRARHRRTGQRLGLRSPAQNRVPHQRDRQTHPTLRSRRRRFPRLLRHRQHPTLSSVTSPGPILWASVKNQFFTSILTPDAPAASFVTRRVKLLAALPDANRNAYGVSGATRSSTCQPSPPAPTPHSAPASTSAQRNTNASPTPMSSRPTRTRSWTIGFFGWACQAPHHPHDVDARLGRQLGHRHHARPPPLLKILFHAAHLVASTKLVPSAWPSSSPSSSPSKRNTRTTPEKQQKPPCSCSKTAK